MATNATQINGKDCARQHPQLLIDRNVAGGNGNAKVKERTKWKCVKSIDGVSLMAEKRQVNCECSCRSAVTAKKN